MKNRIADIQMSRQLDAWAIVVRPLTIMTRAALQSFSMETALAMVTDDMQGNRGAVTALRGSRDRLGPERGNRFGLPWPKRVAIQPAGLRGLHL